MRVDPITGIEVATASARKLQEQRRVAAFSMLRYVLEALDEGAALDQIIGATGFEWSPDLRDEMFGFRARSTRDAFAEWLAREVKTAIQSCD